MASCHQGPFQLFIGDKHNHVPGAQPQKRWHESKRENRQMSILHSSSNHYNKAVVGQENRPLVKSLWSLFS